MFGTALARYVSKSFIIRKPLGSSITVPSSLCHASSKATSPGLLALRRMSRNNRNEAVVAKDTICASVMSRKSNTKYDCRGTLSCKHDGSSPACPTRSCSCIGAHHRSLACVSTIGTTIGSRFRPGSSASAFAHTRSVLRRNR